MWCLWTRWRINRALDDLEPLDARTQRHVERCPQCAAFWGRMQALDHQLVVDAERITGAAPRGRRCMSDQPRRSVLHVVGVTAAAAALLLAVGLFVLKPEGRHQPDPASARALDLTADRLVTTALDGVQRPLSNEARRIASDVEGAITLVVGHFPDARGVRYRPADATAP